MAAEAPLRQLIKSAGKDAEAALMLLQTVLSNIRNDPKEAKFRKLNPESARLKKDLLGHPGAKEFLIAIGFVQNGDGTLVLSGDPGLQFNDALSAVNRHFAALSEHRQRKALGGASKGDEQRLYRAAVEGGAQGAGHDEIKKLVQSPAGIEAMQMLEKVLSNIRLFPTNMQYRSIKLSGKGGQKLLPALPLAKLVGFEVKKEANGEERAEMDKFDLDDIDRVLRMLLWATSEAARAIDMKLLLAMPSPKASAAAAAVLGSAVGDALGGPLEMLERMPLSAKEVDKALEMNGGGHWNLAPGQVTDTTELTIALAEALAASNTNDKEKAKKGEFPSDDAAAVYCEWGETKPFDMCGDNKTAFERRCSAPDLIRRALRNSRNSESNGALMRCTPLAAWAVGLGLNSRTLAQCARDDCELSHANYIVAEASAAYVVALLHLCERQGDRAGAIRAVNDFIAQEKKEGKKTASGAEFVAFDAVEAWLKEAADTSADMTFGPETSDAKIGFVLAFRHLHLGSSYEQAMRATLCGGGDVTANAAIVGGLVGAAGGLQGIPERWIRAIVACDTDSAGQPRPKRFWPRRLPKLLRQLTS
eukprot:TRINITY_DN30993_c0_g1_i1.p1 TRINITY_DN30993_c0_g1~~TRINITY_DN30993_c0_g1_i1.p1  ORF type:complete len:589 (-),score=136.27 TRINITY_DN30993_c0_g1_i1:159-1925(-)